MMMKCRCQHIVLLFLLMVLTACSGKSRFRIAGDTSDGRDLTLRVVMYSPEGIKSEVLATRSGHFEYGGELPQGDMPVFIEMYSNDYNLLGLLAVTRGSDTRFTFDPAGINKFKIEQQKDTLSFNSIFDTWLSQVGTPDNASIEEFVRHNPGSYVSYALLSALYDSSENPEKAYELYSLIEPGARPLYYDNGFTSLVKDYKAVADIAIQPVSLLCSADSFFTIDPKGHRMTLWAFTIDDLVRNDSVAPFLRKVANDKAYNDVLVVEQNLATDTLKWKRTLRTDRLAVERDTTLDKAKKKDIKKWVYVWGGPGVAAEGANNFSISRLPFYAVIDSTGNVVYSGTSSSMAEKFIGVAKR